MFEHTSPEGRLANLRKGLPPTPAAAHLLRRMAAAASAADDAAADAAAAGAAAATAAAAAVRAADSDGGDGGRRRSHRRAFTAGVDASRRPRPRGAPAAPREPPRPQPERVLRAEWGGPDEELRIDSFLRTYAGGVSFIGPAYAALLDAAAGQRLAHPEWVRCAPPTHRLRVLQVVRVLTRDAALMRRLLTAHPAAVASASGLLASAVSLALTPPESRRTGSYAEMTATEALHIFKRAAAAYDAGSPRGDGVAGALTALGVPDSAALALRCGHAGVAAVALAALAEMARHGQAARHFALRCDAAPALGLLDSGVRGTAEPAARLLSSLLEQGRFVHLLRRSATFAGEAFGAALGALRREAGGPARGSVVALHLRNVRALLEVPECVESARRRRAAHVLLGVAQHVPDESGGRGLVACDALAVLSVLLGDASAAGELRRDARATRELGKLFCGGGVDAAPRVQAQAARAIAALWCASDGYAGPRCLPRSVRCELAAAAAACGERPVAVPPGAGDENDRDAVATAAFSSAVAAFKALPATEKRLAAARLCGSRRSFSVG